MDLNARATSFGRVADDYHRWRPSYPEAAVDWLAPPAPARVADVGAGTGKLTELLVSRGLEVEVVEPDQRMLDVLGRHCPTARLHRSDSTRIPLDDAALDAVLVADAWHWFDPEPTVREVRRALKPGGFLGLLWNVAAEPIEPWERAIWDDSDEYNLISKATDAGLKERLSYLPEEELEFHRVAWTWEMSPHHRASFLATTSMVLAMPSADRAAVVEHARDVLQHECEARGTHTVRMRQVASCIRWTPRL
jgi:SAM-dependent methyltransferase